MCAKVPTLPEEEEIYEVNKTKNLSAADIAITIAIAIGQQPRPY